MFVITTGCADPVAIGPFEDSCAAQRHVDAVRDVDDVFFDTLMMLVSPEEHLAALAERPALAPAVAPPLLELRITPKGD